MKKILLLTYLLLIHHTIFTQTSDGLCDYISGTQYSGGGAKGCACTWVDLNGTINCAYGNCGQSRFEECLFDCNGYNGFPTDQQPRICNASTDPLCWYNGGGNFGELTCDNIIISLPISLINFNGNNEGSVNIIEWETISEFNNQHFILIHSTDWLNFQNLVIYPGAGNSNNLIKYRFIHSTPPNEINYYGLVQIDYDGRESSYGPISIDNRINGRRIIKSINLLGQIVDETYRGIVINLYDDGSVEKLYK